MKYKLPLIASLALILTSCATSEYFMADDAYVVKPSDLPVGESTADETSYAAFKKRRTGDTGERLTYEDQWAGQNNRRCLNEPFWYQGCGCSFSYWSMYSPFSSRNVRFSMGYGSMFYNPYGVWGPNGYNAYVVGMNYYYDPFNPYHVYSPGAGWGWANGTYPYYGYGYGYGGNNGVTHASNFHSGPRGSSAGYTNPQGRTTSTSVIKTTSVGRVPSTHGTTAVTSTTSRRPVDNSTSYRNPTTTHSTVSRPTTTRPVVNRQNSSGSSTVNRTYESSSSSRPNVSRQPMRTNGTYNSTGRSSTGGTINTESRSSGGSGTFNSGSSSRSSGGSSGSSGSSSRSGGSSGTNTGRR